jgi:uncharacterized lipoprotein YddW (UPF0748 family)
MVRTAADAGFNALLVQVRGRGEAYYRSDIEPTAVEVAAGAQRFDPLALTLDLAHEAGLSVHAWINVNLVGSATAVPSSPDHVVARQPDWLMVPRELADQLGGVAPDAPGYLSALSRWARGETDRIEGLYLSPALPAAQDYTVGVVRELLERYPVDGLHLDYVRYPDDGFDYSRPVLGEFRAAEMAGRSDAETDRLDRDRERDPAAWANGLPEAWTAFRRDRLTALVSRLAATARALRPSITVSAAVVPRVDEARDHRLQDWVAWVDRGYLDVLCPMLYTTDTATFEAELGMARAAVPTARVWAGIGVYRLSAWRAATHIRAASRGGASGVALFSYDSMTSHRDGGSAYFAHIGPVLLDPASGNRRP